MLVRVLKAEIVQRVEGGSGWRKPEVGDVINVSDMAAKILFERGYAEPASAMGSASPQIVKLETAQQE